MTVSSTDIANMALSAVGAKLITDIDTDPAPRADLCRLHYAQSRDELLALVKPHFANTRVELAELAVSPVFEFQFAYQLPADYITLVEPDLDQDRIPWRIEGDTLITDGSGVFIRYTRRETNTTLFPPLFTQALYILLASKLAMPINKDEEQAQRLFKQFQFSLAEARTADSQQEYPRDQTPDDFIVVR